MMTLAAARLTRIPENLNLCPSDSRVAQYLNQAVSRLLPRAQWRATVVRYRVCVTEDCITWPRQVESILAWALCDIPGTIRSHWYEFLGYGPGQFRGTGCTGGGCGGSWFFGANACGNGLQLIDRGLTHTFDEICGENKKLRVYVDYPADVGKTILFQGWDENGNWVQTDSGTVNGEEVEFAIPYAETSTVWRPGGLTTVQKQATVGPVRVYEYDTDTTLQRLIAYYEPDETLPEYRRSLIPGLSCAPRCCGCDEEEDEECEQKAVTVLAKLKFIPVVAETDYLQISNEGALTDMCKAIKLREDNLMADSLAYEASAVALLEQELANFHGDGTLDPVGAINTSQYSGMGLTSML